MNIRKSLPVLLSALILLVCGGCFPRGMPEIPPTFAPETQGGAATASPQPAGNLPGPGATPDFVQLFSSPGYQQGASRHFTFQAGVVRVSWKSAEAGPFSVDMVRENSGERTQIINTSDAVEGQAEARISAPGNYYFEVTDGPGKWTLTVAYRP